MTDKSSPQDEFNDNQKWVEEIDRILSGVDLGSPDAPGNQELGQLRDSLIWGDGTGTVTYETFLQRPSASIAVSMYPVLQALYTFLYASRAALIDSGVEPRIANTLFANGAVYAQNSISDAFTQSIRNALRGKNTK